MQALKKIIVETFSSCHSVSNKVFNCLLVQKFFQGKHYCVNSMSCNGQHEVISVWSNYLKNHTVPFFHRLVSRNTLIHKRLENHVINTLNTLGVRYGIHHIELIVNDTSIHTIDFNARVSGASGAMLYAAQKVYGCNELSALYHRLTHSTSSQAGMQKLHACIFTLYNHQGIDSRHLDFTLSQLKSFDKCIHFRRFSCESTTFNNLHESTLRIISILDKNIDVLEEDIHFLKSLYPS